MSEINQSVNRIWLFWLTVSALSAMIDPLAFGPVGRQHIMARSIGGAKSVTS
jgi:hypothetical protein